jgi:dTDP-4-dehydrorhamnose 3,5-epimerase-like enzyme
MTVKKIKIFKNKVIKNKKGNIIKFVSTKNIFFKKFGEVYFNEIKYKKKKGWIKHLTNSCIIQCIVGKVKFHMIDNNNKEKIYILKCSSGNILKIPPNIWFSFISLSKKSIIANMIENYHKDTETLKSEKIKNYLIV